MFWYKRRGEPTVNGGITRADHRVNVSIHVSLAAENLMFSLAVHDLESCPMTGIDQRDIEESPGRPLAADITLVIAAGNGKPEDLFDARARH